MKRSALLVAICLVLTGCASGPVMSPGPAPAEVSVPSGETERSGATGAGAGAGTGAPGDADPGSPAATPTPASGAPAPATAVPLPAAPASDPADATPAAPVATPAAPAPTPAAPLPAPQPVTASDRLKGLIRVGLPSPDDLGAGYSDPERMNQSAWATAEAGLHFIYTGRRELGNALAPELADRFQSSPPVDLAARVWTTFASSWDEGQERYYFHLQVTARDLNGVTRRAGIDVIEVSHVPGYGYLVTGFAHAPWASEQPGSPVSVWTGAAPEAYRAPREVSLPALPVAEGGGYLVPLAVAGEIGQVRQVSGSVYVVDLAAGATSGEMTTVNRNGLPYVYVEDLVAALSGRQSALPDASGTYSYQAEWHPESRQLFLWADLVHRMS